MKLHEFPLADGAVLETGCVYIVPLIESLALPATIAAATNPKSSTGRLDVFTRVIADRARSFDQIAAGYHGPLYTEINPRTFPVLVREGFLSIDEPTLAGCLRKWDHLSLERRPLNETKASGPFLSASKRSSIWPKFHR